MHPIKVIATTAPNDMGSRIRENQLKFNKINSQINLTRKHYHMALVNYKEINEIYKRDWSISLNDFYKLEVERIQVTKINCFNYCNNIATLCVDQDLAVDLARPMFAQIQPITDLEEFSGNYGTGNKIFNDPEFVDYMTGCEEPRVGYTLLNFPNPDCSNILTRTYSTYTGNGNTSKQVEQKRSDDKLNDNIFTQPHAVQYDPNRVHAPIKEMSKLPIPKLPPTNNRTKTPSPTRNHLPTIIPTIQMIYFPRMKDYNPAMALQIIVRKEIGHHPEKRKQLQEVQEKISRRATNDFKNIPKIPEPEKVPVIKDFSIDFIAKALEDLNAGGNGDVNQFRRSLRNGRPKSDFIDDSDEVAKRHESINFNRPKSTVPRRSIKLTPVNKNHLLQKPLQDIHSSLKMRANCTLKGLENVHYSQTRR